MFNKILGVTHNLYCGWYTHNTIPRSIGGILKNLNLYFEADYDVAIMDIGIASNSICLVLRRDSKFTKRRLRIRFRAGIESRFLIVDC